MQRAKALRRETLNPIVGLLSWLLVILPAAFGFLYVRAFGVNVVYTDAWSMVAFFKRWHSGRLSLSDLYAQHNEHRMFFPGGVELLMGVVTKYNNLAEMYLIEFCSVVTLGVLLLAFRRTGTRVWPLLFVPVSLLVFSLRQFGNMLLGYQINFAFTQTFGVLTLFLLWVLGQGSRKRLAFVAALSSATVATFSTAQGLLVWPAGLLQLLIGPGGKRRMQVLGIIWALVGLAEWVAYFIDFKRAADKPSLLYALEHPIAGAQYFLTLLGSSLFWQQSSAFCGGLLVTCVVLVSLLLLAKDRKLVEYSFWVSLLFYSLLILASITAGRSAYGVYQAMVPRYATFSVLAVASIYVILTKTALEKKTATNAALLVAMSAIILLSAAISYPAGIEAGRATKAARERAAMLLSTGRYESQPNAVVAATFGVQSAKIVRKRAPVLQRLDYNVFSEPRGGEEGANPSLSPLYGAT